MGVGIVQVEREEKCTPEDPQVGRKRDWGTRGFKIGWTEGTFPGYQTFNLRGNGCENQDQSVAHCAIGGQLRMKEDVTRGERSTFWCKSQEVEAKKNLFR